MADAEIPTLVAASLSSCGAALWRHERGKEPDFIGMATHLGDGLFATVGDQGVESPWGGRGKWQDLRLHLLDGSGAVLWGDWVDSIPNALVVIKARPSRRLPVGPAHAPMHELAGCEYPKVWRIGFGHGVFGDLDHSSPPRMTEGCALDVPRVSFYRNGADKAADLRAVCVHANFDYPRRKDWGSPVVAEDGRLAGVLIGGDLGPERSHQGAYVPVDLVMPHALVALAISKRSRFSGPMPVSHHADFEARVLRLTSVGGPVPEGTFLSAIAQGGIEGWLFAPEWLDKTTPGARVVHLPEGAGLSSETLRRMGLWDDQRHVGKLGTAPYGDTAPTDLLFPLGFLSLSPETPLGTDVAERL